MTITTKAELLAAMSAHGACASAVAYVRAQPDTATAAEIWLGCARADWLAWFGSRHRPAALEALAFACADRAVRAYAADALARAGRVDEGAKLRALAPIVDADTARAGEAAARAADAAAAARAAAHAAEYAAAYAAADYAAADRAAEYAAAYAAHVAFAAAAYDDERRIQLRAIHALADAILAGD